MEKDDLKYHIPYSEGTVQVLQLMNKVVWKWPTSSCRGPGGRTAGSRGISPDCSSSPASVHTDHLYHQHRLSMEVDLQNLFGHHVHSCTHWLRPRNSPSPFPPYLDSYTRALLVNQIDDNCLWPPDQSLHQTHRKQTWRTPVSQIIGTKEPGV